ncbi:hypothetical protein BH09BAC5_BH09BAC5_17070 [soil metagenome]
MRNYQSNFLNGLSSYFSFLTKGLSIAFACLLLFVFSLSAQEQECTGNCCGLLEMQNSLYQQYPGLQQRAALKHEQIQQEGKTNRENNPHVASSPYIIPVVFHILHQYGAENISDAQVFDAMQHINEDFRKLNADTAQLVVPFDTLAADCNIEFRLAQLDPDGNCTNGIDRIAAFSTYFGDDSCKINQWPRDKYLNIWVVRDLGGCGYSYWPALVDSFPSLDGIVMHYTCVGSIGASNWLNAHKLTHEIGHYLGIYHTWGNTNQVGVACGDDGIADTPETEGSTLCPLTNNDICNPGQPENVQNFMDYSYCTAMFTPGQRDAMQNSLNSSIAHRNNLWTPGNLAATGCLNAPITCKPHADFHTNGTMFCVGSNITLTDNSWGGVDTARIWILSGPVTLTSTNQVGIFNLNTPGWYDVTMIAINAAGSDTLTRSNYVFVSPLYATLPDSYVEGFENPNVFNLGYIANNVLGNSTYFQQTSTAAHTGTGSAYLNDFGDSLKYNRDELITPSYFLQYVNNLQLQFSYAYATRNAGPFKNTQQLTVYTSINCGQTWTVRWSQSGFGLCTAGIITTDFIPTNTSEWRTVTIPLPGNCRAPNVRFKFEFFASEFPVSNNLYLDDINILGTNVGINENSDDGEFLLYPNPSNGNTNLNYSLKEKSSVQFNIYDLSGRLIQSENKGEQPAGNYSTTLIDESNSLSAGTYFVQMVARGKVTTRKLVVL